MPVSPLYYDRPHLGSRKNNLELYFAMDGCDGEMLDIYCDYVTPYHDDSFTMTSTDGLFNLLGEILSSVPADYYYQPHYIKEMNTIEKLRLEKILGRKISNEAFHTYCTREDYESEMGLVCNIKNKEEIMTKTIIERIGDRLLKNMS